MKLGWDFKENNVDETTFKNLEQELEYILLQSCWRWRGVIKFEKQNGVIFVNYTLPQSEGFIHLKPGLNKVDLSLCLPETLGQIDYDLKCQEFRDNPVFFKV